MSTSTFTALAAVALTLLSLALRRAKQRTIPSPRDTLLPKISSKQAAALPYPPDLLPGARDVVTPYGVMRVYEWGPANGDKVLFIHGDTTPAPMLGPIAHSMVDRGCRVIMFDLWGRGYSDTPLDVPHDVRLLEMQIYFATASSSLSWTGAASEGFSIVGYSLGGGIAMAYAADFPYLVNAIVLLAPGGIIRRLPVEYESVFFRLHYLLPSYFLKRLVGQTLGLKTSHSSTESQGQMAPEIPQGLQVVGKEVLDIPGIVQWQFDNHKGFIHSFISTHQHGPIQNQHSDWKRVCDIIRGDTAWTPPSSHSSKLFNSKILVIFGDTDSIIRAEEVSADLLEMMGDPKHVELIVVAGSHDFPVPSCNEVARHISKFCGFKPRI